jgi:lysophospholipase L1-like esterase
MITHLSMVIERNEQLLKAMPDYDINVTIENIYNQLNDIDYIIVEVCTLKKLVIDGVPMFLDTNDASMFSTVSDDEFAADFDNLVNLVKDINPNIKILFVSHIVKYKEMVIPEREKTLNLLNKCSEKYNNCHVLSPSNYITDYDLEDSRHYSTEGYNKIRNAIADKIININK